MERQPFTIDQDMDRKFVTITMRGFWDADKMASYDAALRGLRDDMARVGCARAELRVLIDMRELGVQQQEIVAAYKERFSSPDRLPGRLATIVSSALLKRQVERVAIPHQRIFTDEREALDWLLG